MGGRPAALLGGQYALTNQTGRLLQPVGEVLSLLASVVGLGPRLLLLVALRERLGYRQCRPDRLPRAASTPSKQQGYDRHRCQHPGTMLAQELPQPVAGRGWA